MSGHSQPTLIKLSDKKNFVTKTGADESVAECSDPDFEDADDEFPTDSVPQEEASGNLVCHLCDREFKYSKRLQNHLIRHSQIKPCAEIGANFVNKDKLEQLSVEEGRVDSSGTQLSVPLKCDSCRRTFKSVGGRKRHRCINLDLQQSNRKQHSVEEQGVDASETGVPAILKCDICQKTFQKIGNLQSHRCRDLNGRPFTCDHCGQVFRSKSILNEHVNIHTRKKAFVCDVCNRIFAHRCTLRQHRYYVHIGEKPHKCEVCGKYLAHRSALKQHSRLHTGELPYECDMCHRKFNAKGNLRTHYFVHTGEYPFSCDICQKGFREKKKLLDHYAVHSDSVKNDVSVKKLPKPGEVVCDVCGKEFLKPSKLKVHYRTHTGERPYTCEECGMSFTQNVLLKNHSYTHTNDYPFKCFVCDKGFCYRIKLCRHLNKSHGEHSAQLE